jgi:hypothetical protein
MSLLLEPECKSSFSGSINGNVKSVNKESILIKIANKYLTFDVSSMNQDTRMKFQWLD